MGGWLARTWNWAVRGQQIHAAAVCGCALLRGPEMKEENPMKRAPRPPQSCMSNWSGEKEGNARRVTPSSALSTGRGRRLCAQRGQEIAPSLGGQTRPGLTVAACAQWSVHLWMPGGEVGSETNGSGLQRSPQMCGMHGQRGEGRACVDVKGRRTSEWSVC